MYARALFDIVHASGGTILRLLLALEGGADELFASPNTLATIEDHLAQVARTLAHLPPVVLLRLPQVDWAAWGAVHQALQQRDPGRREIVWYAVCSVLPATLVLLDRLREREPAWFEIQY
jgi:hypothetical protein